MPVVILYHLLVATHRILYHRMLLKLLILLRVVQYLPKRYFNDIEPNKIIYRILFLVQNHSEIAQTSGIGTA